MKVHRPYEFDHNKPIKTANWEVQCGYGTCPRDVLLPVNNSVIIAPQAWRCRTNDCMPYYGVLRNCFIGECVHAPRPFLHDSLYDNNYPNDVPSRIHKMNKGEFGLYNNEVIFDAADFLRCGKHIFAQQGITTNQRGIEWVQNKLGSDYTVHTIQYEKHHSIPTHIDARLMFPDKGFVIECPDCPLGLNTRKLFNDAGWDIHKAPEPNHIPPSDSVYSKWMNINMLPLGNKKVMVEEGEKNMIHFMEEHGFDVIQVPFTDVYKFGGGLHCHTVDLVRNGELQSVL